MGQSDQKNTKSDQDLGKTSEPKVADEASKKDESTQADSKAPKEKTTEEVSAEQVAATTPDPGNPYTVSADGRGRPYNPAVDGAPGKEAEKKQAEADSANS